MQLNNHSSSCSPPYYPYFSFLTFNPAMQTLTHTVLLSRRWEKIFLFILPLQFSEIFIPHLQTPARNPLCFEVLKTSVTPKAVTPWSQEMRPRCRAHDQSHSQPKEQQKSIIMKYHLSTGPLAGVPGQGKFSPSRAHSGNPSCLV